MTAPSEDFDARLRRLEEMHRDMTPEGHRDDLQWIARYRGVRAGVRDFWIGTWKMAARIFLTITIPAILFWVGRALYYGLVEAVRAMSSPVP